MEKGQLETPAIVEEVEKAIASNAGRVDTSAMVIDMTNPLRWSAQLKALPCTTVAQDGDDGANVVFPVEHFDEVPKIMKPPKRRRLSDAQRQQAAERLRKYQPTKGQSVRDLARQRSETAQILTIEPQGLRHHLKANRPSTLSLKTPQSRGVQVLDENAGRAAT